MICAPTVPFAVRVDEVKIKYSVCNSEGAVIQSDWADAQSVFDNSILATLCDPTGVGSQMKKYRIQRRVTVNGKSWYVYAKTEQEYADKIIALYTGISDEGAMAPEQKAAVRASKPEPKVKKHNFTDYAWNWYETYSKPNVATVTAICYRNQIETHLLPHLGKLNVEDITTDDLQRMFNSMDCAKTTKTKLRMVLNQILDAAVDDNLIAKSPLRTSRLKINGYASTETPTYSVEQMKHIVSHLSDIKIPQDRLFMAMMALHPLRLEEALGLMWQDIDLEKQTFCIRRAVTHPKRNQPEIKETKTEKSRRVLALSRIAAEYLKAEEKREGFVIGGEAPISYTQLRHMCQHVEKDIGFDEKISPIRFRTTVLTDIYDQTKDLRLTQDSGGHATPTMTLKHYVKGREVSSRGAEAIDNLYSG